MQSIEAETWNTFSRMTNVRDLDLASLHHVAVASIVRDNPAKLFPAVTELCLVGWMHRGLASAIITALDPKQLLRFQFDCLRDEGSMPGGLPMHFEVAEDQAGPAVTKLETTKVDEMMFQCQQAGEIFTFTGPMWYTIRLLRTRPLERLAHLKIKLPVCEMNLDVRNFHTMFDDAKKLIMMTQRTLKCLEIVVGESEETYFPQLSSGCGTGSSKRRQPWYTWINACFLREVALALAQGDFPQLIKVKFAGFHILEMLDDRHADDVSLDETRRQMAAARENLGFDPMFTGRKHLDFRMAFLGYDYNVPWNDA
ncbi:uncharacterized protein RHO25_006737 [Cercospora beticola]|uniref:Uncharacterized protein n=1 Tax=Cercospora beticola TaxID=122368 RepID=A0ABZ0NRC0_CERBT|nr:hypothetical protein RHO25_006737 [Cercospora beticola]CAK1363043.1 unnamed protein product [Cercospora beticola]